jgi:hypothetical protein
MTTRISTDTILADIDLAALADEMHAAGDYDAVAIAHDAIDGCEWSRDAIAGMYRRGTLTHPSEVVQALCGRPSVRVKTATHITGEDADAGIARIADDGSIVVAWDTGVVTPCDAESLVLE